MAVPSRPIRAALAAALLETGGVPLRVATRFTAAATLRNQARLQAAWSVSAASVSAQTLNGPLSLVYAPASSGFRELDDFFDELLALDLGSQPGAAFTLPLANPDEASGALPGDALGPRPPDTFTPYATPEPRTLALLAAGLLATGIGARCRGVSRGW